MAQFALRVPEGFVARMRPGDAADPLLRQVLPIDEEMRPAPGFSFDAVGDGAARKATGVIQKYRGRALLVATGSCAINCRYCFRRHFDYAAENAAKGGWQEAVAAIAGDPDIDEVILSGGDPLSLATHKLVELTDALRAIPHIRRLRIHTGCRSCCRNAWTMNWSPGWAACRGRWRSWCMPTTPMSSMPAWTRRWPACAAWVPSC